MPTMKTLVEAFENARAIEAPLKQRLEALAAWHRELNPAMAAAYDHLVGRLEAAHSGAQAPNVGEPMPGFVLPDHDGKFVSLTSLIESGPAVISFNRGHWCTYCKMEMHSLAERALEIEALGARAVSITPDRQAFARKFREFANHEFQVLTDLDAGYALNLGLAIWIGEEIRSLYEQHNVDLKEYQGSNGSIVPMPATFIVGQDQLVKARFVDPDFRRRMEIDSVIGILRDLAA